MNGIKACADFIFNLLCRGIAFCPALPFEREEESDSRPIENRRYSRLKICATFLLADDFTQHQSKRQGQQNERPWIGPEPMMAELFPYTGELVRL